MNNLNENKLENKIGNELIKKQIISINNKLKQYYSNKKTLCGNRKICCYILEERQAELIKKLF